MIRSVLLGAMLGGPWALGFSPTQWWWLSGLQVVGLACLLTGSPKRAFFVGWSFGTVSLGLGVSWLYISLHTYGGLPAWLAVVSLIFFSLYLGLFAGLAAWAWAIARFERSVWWAASANALLWAAFWVLFEWLRGWLFSGFAWLSLGDVWVDSPIAGLLPWLGNHGASMLLLWIATSLAFSAIPGVRVKFIPNRGTALLRGAALGLPLIVLLVLATREPATEEVGVFKVAGVQPNVGQSIKFDPDLIYGNMAHVFNLGDLAAQLADEDGALIFPETVNPLLWSDSPLEWLQRFRDYSAQRSGVTITGGAIQEGALYFNAVVLFDGTESDAELTVPDKRHDKRHLVPFGETIPPGFEWFVRLLNMPMGEFEPGKGPLQPLLAQDNALAATVCYEDTFSSEFAGLVRGAVTEPTVFLNLSNLAWFGRSWALDQHAQMGRTRSAEHRKPTIRVTNTGVSGAINERGRWVKRIPAWQADVWTAQVQGRTGLTPFAKYGHFVWFLLWMPALVRLMLRAWRIRAYNRVQSI